MDSCLGFGGLGDCFIVILKLLEYKRPFIYTHIYDGEEVLNLCSKLLDYFDINHECVLVDNIVRWWYANYTQFDKCFNVFAGGFIDIPRRPYHWDPCTDEGYSNPFNPDIPEKKDLIAVQINAGVDRVNGRDYTEIPIIDYVVNNYDIDKILWLGTDKKFKYNGGINYCGKTDLIEALSIIAKCKHFVGFPSILLYWSLWNKSECYLFTDHQGRNDLRIHDEWKKHIIYDE